MSFRQMGGSLDGINRSSVWPRGNLRELAPWPGWQPIDFLHDPMPRLCPVVPERANQGNAVRVREYINPRLPPQL